MSSPEISVVIPVYNEAQIVRAATQELCRKLEALGWDFEIVLAENGSRDATRDILRQLADGDHRVRWFHEERADYGRALRRGILEARGRVVLCDEIDLCDVGFYQRALPLIAEGVDLVIGSKAMRGANDERPWIRRIATRTITVLLRLTTGFRGTDTHGLKAFARERDLFASEFVIRAQRAGRDVREIPIALHEKRPPSIQLLRRVPRVLKGLLQLGWTIRVRHR
jgi:glycosyltransferase involved in cell wall biosynthesis